MEKVTIHFKSGEVRELAAVLSPRLNAVSLQIDCLFGRPLEYPLADIDFVEVEGTHGAHRHDCGPRHD